MNLLFSFRTREKMSIGPTRFLVSRLEKKCPLDRLAFQFSGSRKMSIGQLAF